MTSNTLSRDKLSETSLHSHYKGQLFLIYNGLVQIECCDCRYTVVAECIGWIPPNMAHSAFIKQNSNIAIIYLNSPNIQLLPKNPNVFSDSNLSLAIFEKLMVLNTLSHQDTMIENLERVLIDELHHAQENVFKLPLPNDKRLKKVTTILSLNPADKRTQMELASLVGMSAKSLTRLFKLGTGMTLNDWRQILRLTTSIALLKEGKNIQYCADSIGYQSVSSYIQMFKKYFHETPKHFIKNRNKRTF